MTSFRRSYRLASLREHGPHLRAPLVVVREILVRHGGIVGGALSRRRPVRARRSTLVLAHGAGAPMDSPFMNAVAAGIAKEGFRVLRFEFPYMHARREGKRKPPDRTPVLEASWHDAIREAAGTRRAPTAVAIGGKSMGGRIASMVADEAGVAGLLCLGYPFHPPGQPAKLRVAHLEHLKTPGPLPPGRKRRLRRQRRDLALFTFQEDPNSLPPGRRPLLQAAGVLRANGEAEPRGGRGRGGEVPADSPEPRAFRVPAVSPILITHARLLRVPGSLARRGAKAAGGSNGGSSVRTTVPQCIATSVRRPDVTPQRDGLLGIAVDGPHDRRGLVGADRDEREIERPVRRADVRENRAVSRVAREEDAEGRRDDRPGAPEGAVSVERRAAGEVDARGDRRERPKREGRRGRFSEKGARAPCQLADIRVYPRDAKNGRNPTGTIAAGAAPLSLFTFKEISLVRTSHPGGRSDCGRSRPRRSAAGPRSQPRRDVALRAEARERARVVREERVRQDREAGRPDQERRVSEPREALGAGRRESRGGLLPRHDVARREPQAGGPRPVGRRTGRSRKGRRSGRDCPGGSGNARGRIPAVRAG